jgi:hypothetical protein
MTDDFELYDSRVEIACAEFRDKHIGVYVRDLGMDFKDEPVVSITRYGPCLTDIASGRNLHRDAMQEEIIKGTVYVIGRIEEAITELEGHRDRLSVELERLKS